MQTALITGASSGIGLELARIFAENHANLDLVARSRDRLQSLKIELEQSHSITVEVVAKDLTQRSAPDEIYHQLASENISIDFLINNAGIGTFGMFAETEWNRTEQLIDLNISALTHLTRLYVKDMVSRGQGRILNVASTAAFLPGPLMAVYFATKAYVLSFSEAIANELEDTGVTVTVLCPGPTNSGFREAAAMEESGLFKSRNIAASKDVARYGYQCLMEGKKIAIHGLMNRIMAHSGRLAPRKALASIARKMIE
jgi:short-subunit dehydrogenase